jgi:thiol-disulfide isomerase/thioredoxin
LSGTFAKKESAQRNMSSLKAQVLDRISKSAVVVFSKTYCPYCQKTKRLLNDLGVKFDLVELDQVNGGDALQNAVEEITGEFIFILMCKLNCMFIIKLYLYRTTYSSKYFYWW